MILYEGLSLPSRSIELKFDPVLPDYLDEVSLLQSRRHSTPVDNANFQLVSAESAL